MYVVYQLGLLVWIVSNLPSFLFQAFMHRKYVGSLRQRFGLLPPELAHDGRPTVWIHACSLGETLSAQPLAYLLRRQFPGARIVVSTITRTGQTVARQRFAEYDGVFYFPFDASPVVRRVLNHVRPTLMVILEAEIWPCFLYECQERKIPVVLVNGRISARSFPRYRLVAPYLRRIFGAYRLFVMKADEDAERIKAMGAPPEKVVVEGNIKYDRDVVEKARLEAAAQELDHRFLLSQGAPLIVAGSTHDGEEPMVLAAFRQIRRHADFRHVRLLLSPRHPERFEHVAAMLERSEFTFVRYSRGDQPDGAADVILLDTIGKLAAVYRFARAAFVGGTLVSKGGQSILEPAVYGKPMVIGPHMENFSGIIEDFRREDAVIQLREGSREELTNRLAQTLADMLRGGERYCEMGERARDILERNKGATARTVDRIAGLLKG